jgi:hypothetical protein
MTAAQKMRVVLVPMRAASGPTATSPRGKAMKEPTAL